jgi:large subunit ribosomal protein L25
MLERFLAYIRRRSTSSFFSRSKAFKTWFTPQTLTQLDRIGNGKSLMLFYKTFRFTLCLIILHIDFFQIFDDKEITIEVPVKIIGDSKGVMAGGDLRLNNRKLKVKLYQNLPDFVEADITPLNMGNKLYVTKVNPNFKIMHPDNTVVI